MLWDSFEIWRFGYLWHRRSYSIWKYSNVWRMNDIQSDLGLNLKKKWVVINKKIFYKIESEGHNFNLVNSINKKI